MKYLVINNNLPDLIVNKGESDTIPFDPQRIVGENYDFEIDIYQSLKQIIGEEKYDAFIVFINLDKNNNLEFDGLDIAYTLRLSPELRHQYAPIIFLGSLNLEQVLRLNRKADILLTKGVYYFVLNDETNVNIDKLQLADLTPEEYIEFIDRINVPVPGNYKSHHSIANEWALIRYFSMIDNDDSDKKYKTLKGKIENLNYFNTLHFKYSEALITRQKFNPRKKVQIPLINDIKGKRIGIIDDEAIKGWGAFYDYWLSKSGAEIFLFERFEKGKPKEQLINDIKSWIDNQKATGSMCDAYIIDLRLHDDDFYNSEVDNLSGLKVAEYLKKKINPGIQIVISTASNKVWNYQKCIEVGINSFVVKESPETNNTKEETKLSLAHLSREISKAVQKSYLSDIYDIVYCLKNKNISTNSPTFKEFNDQVFRNNGLLDQIFKLLNLDDNKDSILNQCLILCFQVMENYSNHPSVGNFGYYSNNVKTKKLSSGSIFTKDNSIIEIFTSQNQDKILTRFELVYGQFHFQNPDSLDTPKSVKVFPQKQLISAYKAGLDVSSLVKIISVLHFRDSISEKELEELMALRFYRSNVAAHLTGDVKISYKITSKDIKFMLNILDKIFK